MLDLKAVIFTFKKYIEELPGFMMELERYFSGLNLSYTSVPVILSEFSVLSNIG